MTGLAGVKILELGTMVSAAYATKLMADLGADVVKVEEPNGDTARLRGPFPGGRVDPEQSGLSLKAFGQQCGFQGGLAAATATLGAITAH